MCLSYFSYNIKNISMQIIKLLSFFLLSFVMNFTFFLLTPFLQNIRNMLISPEMFEQPNKKNEILSIARKNEELLTSNYEELSRSFENSDRKVFELFQSHFDCGTVLIGRSYIILTENGKAVRKEMNTKNYTFKLMENIVFKPNYRQAEVENALNGVDKINMLKVLRPRFNFESTHTGVDAYASPQFIIGYFAAIAIGAEDIVLDLNNFRLSQSHEHSLMQRFYANIELGSGPFIVGAGPATFANDDGPFVPAKNVAIINGTLGNSSHHAVHGNLGENILLKNIKCEDYEVAALSLNGFTNTHVIDVDAVRNKKDIPILGIWSTLIFIMTYLCEIQIDEAKEEEDRRLRDVIDFRGKSVEDVKEACLNLICDTFKKIIVDNKPETIKPYLRNEVGTVDGNSYGIAFHKRGPLVNGFPTKQSDTASKYIHLKNVVIQENASWVNEIPALQKPLDINAPIDLPEGRMLCNRSAGIQGIENDPVGSVFQFSVAINDKGQYVGNEVSDAQLFVAKKIIYVNDKEKWNNDVARNSISSLTISDAENTTDEGLFFKRNVVFNGDSMFHVNKGNVTLKLDNCDTLLCHNVKVRNSRNTTNRYALDYHDMPGYTEWVNVNDPDRTDRDQSPAHKLYRKKLGLSHGIASLLGSHATDIRGITMSSSNNCYIKNSEIDDVTSNLGSAYGVDVLFDSSNIVMENVTIKDVCAATDAERAAELEDPRLSAQEHDAAFVAIGDRISHIVMNDMKYQGKLCGLTESNVIKSSRFSECL